MATQQYRNFLAVTYPESMHSDWENRILHNQCVKFLGILHNKDTLDDGSVKKAHYHWIVHFLDMKSYDKALEELKNIFSYTLDYIKVCDSPSGAKDYLLHKGLDKHQYNDDELISFNGYKLKSKKKIDEVTVIRSVCKYIYDNNITEMTELVEWALTQDDDILLVVSRKHSFLNSLINSRRYSAMQAVHDNNIYPMSQYCPIPTQFFDD